ncbi:MAG: phosphoribosylglycinamide formyltransferase [Flavobacteriaceae bacterium]|jgi:phosphoribosylglycinamide formyltransferase-1|nr:phosphoribosylglycinamide formyltransferase [Flavobacteriaceae bacterium]
MKKIVIFASGSGKNAQNIVLHFKKSSFVYQFYIFSNNANAKVLERAKYLSVPTTIISKEDIQSGAILNNLKEIQPDLIVLAGFLLKFPNNCIQEYQNKIINIHPSLLPKYGGKGMYGMHVHRAVVENKETQTGITIHYVNENYDEGNIIFQKIVNLTGTESPDEVAEKIYELEQTHFPLIIEKIINQ